MERITLDGFTKYDRKVHANVTVSYTFSPVATPSYKWGVFSGNSEGAFRTEAFAKTRQQAIAYAHRHGLGLFGFVVGKVEGNVKGKK